MVFFEFCSEPFGRMFQVFDVAVTLSFSFGIGTYYIRLCKIVVGLDFLYQLFKFGINESLAFVGGNILGR